MPQLNEWDAAQMLGEQVLDMADRVEKVHAIAPGTTARYGFELNGHRYTLVLSRHN